MGTTTPIYIFLPKPDAADSSWLLSPSAINNANPDATAKQTPPIKMVVVSGMLKVELTTVTIICGANFSKKAYCK